jgi:hypothetical protein
MTSIASRRHRLADLSGTHRSDPKLVLLQTLRCIGFATEERVASASGLSLAETGRRLTELAGAALVSSTPGPFGGWALTEEGRTEVQKLSDQELETTGARDLVLAMYQSFLGLNPVLLDVSTDWQMVRVGENHIVNDHRDPDYDVRILDRLIRVDDKVQLVCSDLAAHISRFGTYGPRLSIALNRALAGDHAYVSDNLDSYHSVWFQLHEDLLSTLGISREEERSSALGGEP